MYHPFSMAKSCDEVLKLTYLMTNSADSEKPTNQNLHCLLRQGMSCSAREGLIMTSPKNGHIFFKTSCA